MTVITREIWDTLPEERREELLGEHREVWFNDWADHILEQFVEEVGQIGIHTSKDEIYWSGFWNQGDGACFEGHVQDWTLFLIAVGLPKLAALSYGPDSNGLRWRHSGHYYHEYCVRFESELLVDNPYDADADLVRSIAWNASYGQDGPFAEHEELFIDFLRGKMRELYKQLNDEYDYLTGDEATLERILGNVELEEDEEEEETANPFV